ncbi:16167_t:CDS:2, partial [Acaulospora colombiana]
RRNSDVLLLWKFKATDEEIASTLSLVDANERPDVSKLIDSERRTGRYRGILHAFESLIEGLDDENQRNIVIELLCNELSGIKPSLSQDSFRIWILDEVQDPWVRFVASLAVGMGQPLEHPSIAYSRLSQELMRALSKYLLDDGSFINSLSAQRVRMRWWNALPQSWTSNVINQAMGDIEALVRRHILYRVFHYGGGLRPAFVGGLKTRVWGDMYGLVPALLAGSDVEVYIKDKALKPECLSRLQEFVEDVKHHPIRLNALLFKLVDEEFGAM